jgi:hypothetical protein
MAREPKKTATTSAAATPVKKATPAKKPAAPKAAKPATTTGKKAAAPKKPAEPKKPAAAAKAPAKTRTRKASKPAVTPEERYRMIQDAAYYIAEKHGFTGDNHGFWLQAEQEIDAKLAG